MDKYLANKNYSKINKDKTFILLFSVVAVDVAASMCITTTSIRVNAYYRSDNTSAIF